MNQRSSSSSASDPFVPFAPPAPAAGASSSTPPPSPHLQLLPRNETAPPFTPLEARVSSGHVHGTDGPKSDKPVVTLQRDGDRVTGVRIECVCGQVIELACSYGPNPLAP